MTEQKTKILKRELAELLGCLPIVVSRLVKKGAVKVGVDGKIDISTPEMKEYIKNKKNEIQKHKDRIKKKDLKIDESNEDKTAIDNQTEIADNIFKNKETEKTIKAEKQDKSFTNIEYETKQHKLESERYKAQLLEMEVKQRKKDLVNTELLNRIITKTIGNLTKNIVEIPINIVDEIIDIVKSEEEPKTLIVNLITKNLHKEIELTIDKTEKEFTHLF